MTASPSIQQPLGDEERQGSSGYFPRISGANTVARPSPMPTATDEAFPTVKLQAKMVKQTPLPYQTQEFRPCIVLKKFEPSVRVSDSFVPGIPTDEALGDLKKKRTVILHTDRYTQHGQMKLESSDSQKVRLAQEGQMLQDARSRMRLREALAHRARHDLHLGGSPLADSATTAAEDLPGGVEAAKASKKSQRRRRRRDRQNFQQQQAGQPMKLGFIPEESAGDSADQLHRHRHRHGQQLGSHSSSAPVGQPSYASRAEFDALSALIGGAAASNAIGGGGGGGGPDALLPGGGGGSGLEKVKLDGSKAVFTRRSDILTEIARLKAIVLPDFAKDLYVGRGIRLPNSHALNNPKKTLLANDPILEALLHRAQQPSRIIDEAGNIFIASNAGSQQQQQQPKRSVFAADVTAKGKSVGTASEDAPKPESLPTESHDADTQQHQADSAVEAAGDEEAADPVVDPLPEPFQGLPTEWMRSADPSGDQPDGELASVREQIQALDLPPVITSYVLAILSASKHSRAGPLSLELGRLLRQRLLANQDLPDSATSSSSSGVLIGWLRRGLDLFHDVDREVKGSVSFTAYLDILSSMRGLPLDNVEAARMQSAFGLSGDSVSKLAFLTVLPFLQDLLNRKA